MIEFEPNITDAIVSLRPGAEWSLSGETYGGLTWLDKVQNKPTEKEVSDELTRLTVEWNSKEYQRQRAKEYPPVTDYLDAVVKGDLAQQQAYIDACLAVKAKYPKPEGV
jgi:hypothetical protein